ncbi:MAG TPA: glycosyltransferase family A protein [Pontiellaceae bacterium]|nr:glycosyltransferase family A protein [Pontiellaceae bacterium]
MTEGVHPKIAVIIPTYNRWPHVCDAIESVLNQSYPAVEAVVVDDASTDGTAEKLAAKYGGRIRLIALKKNGEKSAARNAGILATDAAYVCMLDSDDLLTENSVDDRMKLFSADPSFNGVAYGLIQVNGTLKRNLDVDPEGNVLETFVRHPGFINNNSWLTSRSKLLEVGLFNEALTNMEDRELLLRLTAKLHFRCCKTVVQNVRRVDAVSARSNYDRLIQQGKKYIDTVRGNEALVQRLGSLLVDLEFGEDKTISDALYKSGRYRDYCQCSRKMFSQYGPKMWRIRFLRRHILSFLLSSITKGK